MSTDHWEISNDDLVADQDFAESATDFGTYESFDFYYQVQLVADRIFTIHQDREVRGEFIFGFECNSEGEISAATVAVSCTGEYSLYLMQNLDTKRLTDDREATGWNQVAAIRDALMASYAEVRATALAKGLI